METNGKGRNNLPTKQLPASLSAVPAAAAPGVSSHIPEGYLRFSDAVDRLCLGMFASLQRPVPVREAKATYFSGSVGFGPWREQAAERIATAAKDGELRVCVFGNPQAYNKGVGESEIIAVPAEVLRRMVTSRGGFPDHPRACLKAAGKDGQLFAAVNTGVLVVAEDTFSVWYRKEKAKGRWPSQASKLKKVGRPSKQTEPLENFVAATLAQEKTISVAALYRRLVDAGRSDISVDTLERLVKRLYLKTGDKRYSQIRCLRRKPRWGLRFPQNPFRNSGKNSLYRGP